MRFSLLLLSSHASSLLMMIMLSAGVVNSFSPLLFSTTPSSSSLLIPRQQHKDNLLLLRSTATTTSVSTIDDEPTTTTSSSSSSSSDSDESSSSLVVKAPLKYLGPYVALGLKFPNAATSNQRSQNKTGVSLDFVLDTAANVNTINSEVAKELRWDQNIVGTTLPGYSSSGTLSSGYQTYMLGDVELEAYSILSMMNNDEEVDEIVPPVEDEDEDEKVEPLLFMQNLTASSLPVASPASAGLLSLAFMYCFEGGIEFDWGSSNNHQFGDNNNPQQPPSITFFSDSADSLAEKSIEGLTKIPIEPIQETNLPSITIEMNNGIQIPALLDTGSPITVVNSKAADLIGIKTIDLPAAKEETTNKKSFAAVASKFKQAQAISEAASKGEILTIAGQNGPVNLLKSLTKIPIKAVDTTTTTTIEGDNKVTFGGGDGSSDNDGNDDNGCYVYVGDIPGLAALNGLSGNSGHDDDNDKVKPAMILGLDVLRRQPKMVLRAQDNEVYF